MLTGNGPFAQAALDYHDAGFFPIPTTPHGYVRKGKIVTSKIPMVRGYSGYHENWPDREQVEEWIEDFGRCNIGLRLSKDMIGIDVDSYEGKRGLEFYERNFGVLPPTWISTSKHDGISGIRLYRLSNEIDASKLVGQLGHGLEIIKWCHRFVSVPPSVHVKTGDRYFWISPKGVITTNTAPQGFRGTPNV